MFQAMGKDLVLYDSKSVYNKEIRGQNRKRAMQMKAIFYFLSSD